MMAADNLGIVSQFNSLASYGGLARFRDVQRLKAVGDTTVVGASGDISDYQHIEHMLDGLT